MSGEAWYGANLKS